MLFNAGLEGLLHPLFSPIMPPGGRGGCGGRRRKGRAQAKALIDLEALRGPFDFAQGKLLKRRSSTVPQRLKAHRIEAFTARLKSCPSRAS
jgi:hypothetical protein